MLPEELLKSTHLDGEVEFSDPEFKSQNERNDGDALGNEGEHIYIECYECSFVIQLLRPWILVQCYYMCVSKTLIEKRKKNVAINISFEFDFLKIYLSKINNCQGSIHFFEIQIFTKNPNLIPNFTEIKCLIFDIPKTSIVTSSNNENLRIPCREFCHFIIHCGESPQILIRQDLLH